MVAARLRRAAPRRRARRILPLLEWVSLYRSQCLAAAAAMARGILPTERCVAQAGTRQRGRPEAACRRSALPLRHTAARSGRPLRATSGAHTPAAGVCKPTRGGATAPINARCRATKETGAPRAQTGAGGPWRRARGASGGAGATTSSPACVRPSSPSQVCGSGARVDGSAPLLLRWPQTNGLASRQKGIYFRDLSPVCREEGVTT